MEQVTASIARNAKLGEHRNSGPIFLSKLTAANNLRSVKGSIRNLQVGANRSKSIKSEHATNIKKVPLTGDLFSLK